MATCVNDRACELQSSVRARCLLLKGRQEAVGTQQQRNPESNRGVDLRLRE